MTGGKTMIEKMVFEEAEKRNKFFFPAAKIKFYFPGC